MTDRVLLLHAGRYPQMGAGDAVKLIYQSEFGGGHMIADEAASLKLLIGETAALPPGSAYFVEPIGGGLVRMHLGKDLPVCLTTLNRFFVNTANGVNGSAEGLERKLSALLTLCQNGLMPFGIDEAREYIASYRAEGYPAVSHTEAYRAAYSPHYRVVDARYAQFVDVFSRIDALIGRKDRVIAAIDGMSGAGKSALSSLIESVYDCNAFHMDDFFLTPDMRTPERFAEVGGNIDHERFRGQVIAPLLSGERFSYDVFDCGTLEFTRSPDVTPKPLNIVEGVYSLHPSMDDAYDLSIFLGIDPAEQQRRILARSGEELLARYNAEWLPLENRYFEELRLSERADLRVNTGN